MLERSGRLGRREILAFLPCLEASLWRGSGVKVEETPDPFLVGREVPSLKWREELGSGCESDIGGEGGGWLGDLKVTGGRREGRIEGFKGEILVVEEKDVQILVHIMYTGCRRCFAHSSLPLCK